MNPERERHKAESDEVLRVLARQKELQEAIKAAQDAIKAHIQELEEIAVYLKVRARIASAAPAPSPEGSEPPKRQESAIAVHQSLPSKKLGYGRTQPAFEQLACEAMLAEGQPLETYEMVQVLRERGTPLGGTNEWKTASNRLWRGKQNGVFEHEVGRGYWPAGVPWPDPDPNRVKRPRPKGIGHRATGRPMGREKVLSEADVERARQWLLEGRTVKEVAALLGGVSTGTIYNYFPGGKAALRQKHPDEAAPISTTAVAMPHVSDEERDRIVLLREGGMQIRDIARQLGMSHTRVWRTLKALETAEASS